MLKTLKMQETLPNDDPKQLATLILRMIKLCVRYEAEAATATLSSGCTWDIRLYKRVTKNQTYYRITGVW